MTERLVTLQLLKDFLSVKNADSDEMLTRIIDAASQFVLNYINRDTLQAKAYLQSFRGNGKCNTLLRHWPVLSISTVKIGSTDVPQSNISTGVPTSGFLLEDDRAAPASVQLYGYSFLNGYYCQISYRAGYETLDTETLALNESADPFIYVAPRGGGQWTSDLGVTLNDIAATKVSDNPSVGEYSVDPWGNYSFAAADAGKQAVMSYSYAPWDLSFGTLEIVGEWYKRRDRLGLLTKTLGGQETITFSQKDLNDSTRLLIQPYRNVVPV